MAAVTNALASLGLTADQSRTRRVLDEIRIHAVALKRPIENLELLEFYAATAPKGSACVAKVAMDLETQC
jgi:homocitrate synthase NifV